MRVAVLAVVVCLSCLLGCSSPDQDADSPAPGSTSPGTNQTSSAPAAQPAPAAKSAIPDDVSYRVVDSDIIPGVKRALTVELNKKVSQEVLREIAKELKSRDAASYDRTFITYYLPGMDIGSGAWATTHFDPSLEVKILGLSSTEEAVLKKAAAPEGREILGEWIDDRPYVASRVTLYREKGALHVAFAFKDGSVWDNEVREISSSLGRRFDPVEPSATGDHWVIDSSGNLQERDNEGLIATARKAR